MHRSHDYTRSRRVDHGDIWCSLLGSHIWVISPYHWCRFPFEFYLIFYTYFMYGFSVVLCLICVKFMITKLSRTTKKKPHTKGVQKIWTPKFYVWNIGRRRSLLGFVSWVTSPNHRRLLFLGSVKSFESSISYWN